MERLIARFFGCMVTTETGLVTLFSNVSCRVLADWLLDCRLFEVKTVHSLHLEKCVFLLETSQRLGRGCKDGCLFVDYNWFVFLKAGLLADEVNESIHCILERFS